MGAPRSMGGVTFLLLLLLLPAASPQELGEPEEYTECTDGYEWDPETEHCKDVDECSAGPAPPCRGALQCLNHFGGYLCLPRSAAVISPAHPEPPLAPQPLAPPPAPPPALPLAPPIDGRCPTGYRKTPEGACQDVDECSGPPPCRPSQECINLPGGFECQCPPGYRLLRTECVDEDECRVRWCHQGCANSPGAFSCRCQPGFSLGPDGRACLDVDECALGARCSQRCLNTFGSFRCQCRVGFRLQPDGTSCHDVDECVGSALCQHRCLNSPGSFRCLCPRGYHTRGLHCHDVDECRLGSHSCSGSQRCLNTFGAYRCLPRRCPAPYSPRHNRTCVCPVEVSSCVRLPRWLLLSSVALPKLSQLPAPIFQLRHGQGAGPRLRLKGAPHGLFRLRELSNQSTLLELARPVEGPRDLQLEVELLPARRGHAHPPGQAPPPRGPAFAVLRLSLSLGEFPF